MRYRSPVDVFFLGIAFEQLLFGDSSDVVRSRLAKDVFCNVRVVYLFTTLTAPCCVLVMSVRRARPRARPVNRMTVVFHGVV